MEDFPGRAWAVDCAARSRSKQGDPGLLQANLYLKSTLSSDKPVLVALLYAKAREVFKIAPESRYS